MIRFKHSLVLAPESHIKLKRIKVITILLALHHGGQNSWHRWEWGNYVTVTLCI